RDASLISQSAQSGLICVICGGPFDSWCKAGTRHAVSLPSRRAPQAQALRAADQEGVDVFDARLAAFAARQLVEQGLERDARFQPGQRGAEAAVGAEAESELARRLC